MNPGMAVFRGLLCILWLVLLVMTIHAVQAMGIGAAATVFLADYSHPWRAQYNTDFAIHTLLAAAWMVYRSRAWPIGLLCAFLALNMGSMFTLAYLLVATFQAKGDMVKVLLGARAPQSQAGA
ncbi:MAG: hypothetical protein JO303_15800 [Caulobacteraceae bacterium]|nr:hypothetical protein [Caulobacteraceae bacterium]